LRLAGVESAIASHPRITTIQPGSTRPAEDAGPRGPRPGEATLDTGGGSVRSKRRDAVSRTRRGYAFTGARTVQSSPGRSTSSGAVGPRRVVIVTVSLASPRRGTDDARGLAISRFHARPVRRRVDHLAAGPEPGRRMSSRLPWVHTGEAGGVLAGLSPKTGPAVRRYGARAASGGRRPAATRASLAMAEDRGRCFPWPRAGWPPGAETGALLGLSVRLGRAVEREP